MHRVTTCATGFGIKLPALHPKNKCMVLVDVRSFTGFDYVDSSRVTLMVASTLSIGILL
jgi:hypothetical protein